MSQLIASLDIFLASHYISFLYHITKSYGKRFNGPTWWRWIWNNYNDH